MADHEIKTKLKLEGESEYSAALKQSYQNLRVLNSELKKEESALKDSATEQEKAKAKSQILNKKIEEQKKIVETLSKALEQSKKQFGESSSETAKWQIKLNNATTALNNMNNELGGLDTKIDDTSVSMGQSAQQTANMAEAWKEMGSLVQDIGSTIAGVAKNMVNNIKNAVEQIQNLMGVAMASVGQWKGISDVYGGSDEEIQKMFFGMSSLGLSTGGIASSIQALNKRLYSGTNTSALEALGIDASASASRWDTYMQALNAIAQLSGTEQYEAIENVFGTGQTDEIQAVMTHWDEIWGHIGDTEKAGGFLSQSVIDQVDQASQSLDTLKTDWATFQTFLGSQLIVKLNWGGIINDTDGVLHTLMQFMSADTAEGKMEALVNLTGSIDILSTDLSTMLNDFQAWLDPISQALTQSDQPLLSGLGYIVGQIQKALQWLNSPENAETIKKFVDYFIKNKMVELMTGKSIPEWASTIIGYVSQIVTIVTLIAHKSGIPTTASNAANAAGNATAAGASWLSKLGGVAALPTMVTAYLAGLVQVGKWGNEHKQNTASNAQFVTNGLSAEDPALAALRNVGLLYSEYVAKDEAWMNGESDEDSIEALQAYQTALDGLKELEGGQQLYNKFITWKSYNPGGAIEDYIDETFGALEEKIGQVESAVDSFVETLNLNIDQNGSGQVSGADSSQTIEIVTTLDGAEVARNQYQYLRTALIEDLQTR